MMREMKPKSRGMRLIRVHPDPGATEFLLQASHHRTAIEAAVDCVNAGFARSLPEHANDMLSSELSSIEHQWVIETIYQGAYLREYHLWEKSCKEYFPRMGVNMKISKKGVKPSKRGGAFTDHVKGVLSHCDLVAPADVMDALSTMNCKVNRMKHEGGVHNDEFVSAADYGEAVAAIERFWEFLVEKEQTR